MNRLVLVALILLSGTAHAEVPEPAPLDEMIANRFARAVLHDEIVALKILPAIEERAREVRSEWVESYEDWKARQQAPEPTGSATVAPAGSVQRIICQVFGPYCTQALAVAACESGFSTAAVNGQYLGIFQMGATERATYGHGSDALSQAQAAYRYFVASGRDWSPWQCKP